MIKTKKALILPDVQSLPLEPQTLSDRRFPTLTHYILPSAHNLLPAFQSSCISREGKGTFELSADTIDEALQTKGKGGYIFLCAIPLMGTEAVATCMEKSIDIPSHCIKK